MRPGVAFHASSRTCHDPCSARTFMKPPSTSTSSGRATSLPRDGLLDRAKGPRWRRKPRKSCGAAACRRLGWRWWRAMRPARPSAPCGCGACRRESPASACCCSVRCRGARPQAWRHRIGADVRVRSPRRAASVTAPSCWWATWPIMAVSGFRRSDGRAGDAGPFRAAPAAGAGTRARRARRIVRRAQGRRTQVCRAESAARRLRETGGSGAAGTSPGHPDQMIF